ncbi:MAG: hypothetical protein ACFWT8_10290 [Lacticaseibacillus casei]
MGLEAPSALASKPQLAGDSLTARDFCDLVKGAGLTDRNALASPETCV